MKKIFINSIVILSFAIIMTVILVHKSEAAVTASISAAKTSVVAGSSSIKITYGSTGADSCTTNFNNSTDTSGTFYFDPAVAGSYTFSVTCQKVYPTTTSCFGGFYADPDPLHPDGGTVWYTAPNGTPSKETNIHNDDTVYIEYRNGTSSSVGAGKNAGECPYN